MCTARARAGARATKGRTSDGPRIDRISHPWIGFAALVVLGLRSLVFLLAGLVERFRYLKVGLGAVLVFAGAKMAAVDLVKVPPALSVAVIATVLAGSMLASWWATRSTGSRPATPAHAHRAGAAPGG